MRNGATILKAENSECRLGAMCHEGMLNEIETYDIEIEKTINHAHDTKRA